MGENHVLNISFARQVGDTIYLHRYSESENLVVRQK